MLRTVDHRMVAIQRRWPDGSRIDRKAPGQLPRLNDDTGQASRRSSRAADPGRSWVVRWRIVDLRQWIFEESAVVVSRQTLSRELRAMGYRKLSARPGITRRLPARLRMLKSLPLGWTRSRARTASLPRP